MPINSLFYNKYCSLHTYFNMITVIDSIELHINYNSRNMPISYNLCNNDYKLYKKNNTVDNTRILRDLKKIADNAILHTYGDFPILSFALIIKILLYCGYFRINNTSYYYISINGKLKKKSRFKYISYDTLIDKDDNLQFNNILIYEMNLYAYIKDIEGTYNELINIYIYLYNLINKANNSEAEPIESMQVNTEPIKTEPIKAEPIRYNMFTKIYKSFRSIFHY